MSVLCTCQKVVLRVGMDTFHRLFAQRPSRAVVSTDFNGKMINVSFFCNVYIFVSGNSDMASLNVAFQTFTAIFPSHL